MHFSNPLPFLPPRHIEFVPASVFQGHAALFSAEILNILTPCQPRAEKSFILYCFQGRLAMHTKSNASTDDL